MKRKYLAHLVVFVVVATFGFVSASQESGEDGSLPGVAGTAGSHQPEETLEQMSLYYELWVDVNLKGNEEKSAEYEAALIELVGRDVSATELKVRELAERAALSGQETAEPSRKGSGQRVTHSEPAGEERAAFKQSRSQLSIKETIYHSLGRTDAFSNKYRLLGDYIDLLRRELEMPRLKLANVVKRGPEPPGWQNGVRQTR